MGELKRSSRPPGRNKRGLLLRGRKGRGGESKGRGKRRGKRRGNLLQGVGGIDAPG